MGWARCVYGNTECSLTVATYLLCVLGIFALGAVTNAAQALEHQKTAVLAVQRCLHGDCATVRRQNLYLESDGQKPRTSTDQPPKAFYDPIPVDFLSVGLAPILSGAISLGLKEMDQTKKIQDFGTIEIGTLSGDDRLHLSFYVLSKLGEGCLHFTDARHEGVGGQQGKFKPLEFHVNEESLITQLERDTTGAPEPPEQPEPNPARDG